MELYEFQKKVLLSTYTPLHVAIIIGRRHHRVRRMSDWGLITSPSSHCLCLWVWQKHSQMWWQQLCMSKEWCSAKEVSVAHQGLGVEWHWWVERFNLEGFNGFSNPSARFNAVGWNKQSKIPPPPKKKSTVTFWLCKLIFKHLWAGVFIFQPSSMHCFGQRHTVCKVCCMSRWGQGECATCSLREQFQCGSMACMTQKPWLASVFSCSNRCVSMAIYHACHCFPLMMPREQEAWSKTGSASL